jgi:hypothetical protein
VYCFSGLMGMEHLHPEVGVIEVGRMYREVPGGRTRLQMEI